MGSKHASIHLRCDDSSAVITKLKKQFNKKRGPSKKDQAFMNLLMGIANSNISKIEDPREKAEKESVLADVMKQAEIDMGAEAPAVIVIREHFVSIYWYDHLRSDNLREEFLEYSYKYKVPALGVGIFDGSNFQIYAARDAGSDKARGYAGEYMFDYDDLKPVKAEDVCEVIDAPFFLEALKEALACKDGEEMAAAFERGTGLPIFMDEAMCRESGMKELHRLGGAVIFSTVE